MILNKFTIVAYIESIKIFLIYIIFYYQKLNYHNNLKIIFLLIFKKLISNTFLLKKIE